MLAARVLAVRADMPYGGTFEDDVRRLIERRKEWGFRSSDESGRDDDATVLAALQDGAAPVLMDSPADHVEAAKDVIAEDPCVPPPPPPASPQR